MDNTNVKSFKSLNLPKLSVKMKALATAVAVVSAVAFPQLFHTLGNALGVQTALGELLLPMHLPIILVGLFAGPYAGAAAGILAPMISFALTGMPRAEVLIFMTVELFAYGLFAGIFSDLKFNSVLKVLSVQVLGRAARMLAVAIAIYAFKNESLALMSIWKAVVVGLPGIVSQLVIIPIVINLISKKLKKS